MMMKTTTPAAVLAFTVMNHAVAQEPVPAIKVDFDIHADVQDSVTLLQMAVKKDGDTNTLAVADSSTQNSTCDEEMVCSKDSTSEFVPWCNVGVKLNYNKTLCEEYVECGDSNKDGYLSYAEYTTNGWSPTKPVATCNCPLFMQGTFQAFDTNHDGYLEVGEYGLTWCGH